MNHKRVKPQMTNTKQRERVDSFVDNRRGKHEESLTADVYQHVQLKDFPLDDAVIWKNNYKCVVLVIKNENESESLKK